MKNPLDHPGDIFDLGLCNPNPTSSKTKAGPVYRISFEVERETWDLFMEAKTEGMLIAAKATVVSQDEHEALEKTSTSVTGQWGKEANRLRQSGFFRVPKVWEAVGTDEQFLSWVRTQPCAYCRHHDCSGQVVPAHVRRVANGAGTGVKPPYSAIPLCHAAHEAQHQYGESAIGSRSFFDQARVKTLEDWSWETLKATLGYESWSQVPPEKLYNWAFERDLLKYLPSEYK